MARPAPPLRRLALPALVLLCAGPGAARAADGVTEINAVRVRDGGITGSDGGGVPVTIDASGSYRLTGDISSSIGAVGVIRTNPGASVSCSAFVGGLYCFEQ